MTSPSLADAFAASPSPPTVEQQAAARWQPDPFLEGVRRLMASGHPEDHRRAEQLVAGPRRISLGSYVDDLRAYVAAGNQLPEGVLAP